MLLEQLIEPAPTDLPIDRKRLVGYARKEDIVVSSEHFGRSEEHTSELQSPDHLVCRLLLEKMSIAPTFSRSAAVACAPPAKPAAPAPTTQGILGITRTTRAPLAKLLSIRAIGTPAATETNNFASPSLPAISLATGSTICGFTASMTMSAKSATFRLSAVALTPRSWAMDWRSVSLTSLAMTWSLFTSP